jgi:hypothetical protein
MDMVQHGGVALTDPVLKYLPPSVKEPERNNRKITPQDLSTQSSGLPPMPSDVNPKDGFNPYADYSIEPMYRFLPDYQLTRDVREKCEHSNFGVGPNSCAPALDYEALVIWEHRGGGCLSVTAEPAQIDSIGGCKNDLSTVYGLFFQRK